MAWVRIDDHFPDHPKIVAAGPLAAWLYVTALCYCNRLLTNGFIPMSQVERLAPHREDQDIRDLPILLARKLCDLRLWTQAERKGVVGFTIHDFLKYQPSKAQIIKERANTAARQGRFRHGKRNGVSNGVTSGVSHGPSNSVPTPTPIPRERVKNTLSLRREKVVSTEPDLGAVAAHFCEQFVKLYAHHRHGAHYHLKPNLDWTRVCDLLRTWTEARLEKLAVILLTTDDEWIAKTDRGIGVFVARASWCDDRLKAWEVEHGVKA